MALLAVVDVHDISPAQIGMSFSHIADILTTCYPIKALCSPIPVGLMSSTLSLGFNLYLTAQLAQMCGGLTRQSADVEVSHPRLFSL